mgnify:CR=1 FL=1
MFTKILDIRQSIFSKMTRRFTLLINKDFCYIFLMGDEKTRLVLTIEEKLSIFKYKESHPEKSFATIANIFTESSKRQKTEATCNN